MWANILSTLVAAVLTGFFGFFTARLTARVQEQAQSNQVNSGESERAWKRADTEHTDAEKWREKWAAEFEKRVLLEAEVKVLKGQEPSDQEPQNPP